MCHDCSIIAQVPVTAPTSASASPGEPVLPAHTTTQRVCVACAALDAHVVPVGGPPLHRRGHRRSERRNSGQRRSIIVEDGSVVARSSVVTA